MIHVTYRPIIKCKLNIIMDTLYNDNGCFSRRQPWNRSSIKFIKYFLLPNYLVAGDYVLEGKVEFQKSHWIFVVVQ